MKTLWFVLLATWLGAFALPAQTNDYSALKAEAEKLISDGSYAKAHDAYEKLHALDLAAAEMKWVDFRLADTQWRSAAATRTADNTQLEDARRQLEVMIRDVTRVEDHDRVWAEIEESLGDFHWTRRNSQNWGAAWGYYQAALDWWAGTAELELARERYLKIVWTCARPASVLARNYYYGMFGNNLPLDVLDNAVKIAQSETDQAHAHYLRAMALRQQGGGDWDQRARLVDDFEAAIQPGKNTEWYDDALYNYADWMVSQGRAVPVKDGGWRQEPDYVKALELFRRLTREFTQGESRYYPQAEQQIKNITAPVVSVSVANIFLPDSEIQYSLNWRNVKRIDLTLYEVDLARDVQMSGTDPGRNDWLQSIDLAGREKVKTWSQDAKDTGEYKPGSATLRYDGKLAPGAYVLEARGEGASARELVLVTDASVVLKVSGKQALVYFCNALDGSPLPTATVHLWERYYESDRTWHWHDATKETDTNGIAVFDLERSQNNEQIFAGARVKDRQAFDTANNYFGRNDERETWKIYATTDRPAYRPKETVQWKFTARKYNGSVYSTPSDQEVAYEIHDPRNTKVKEGKVTVNAFGSAWGSLDLTETMPLGEYQIIFWDPGHNPEIGRATLFRLEEYKLPEFKVAVKMPEENGKTKTFRTGEKVEVNIQSDYYFGGPVANANVEVIVYQNPLYRSWHPPHEFPWFYEDATPQFMGGRFRGGGPGQIIKRETLKTDVTGKAVLTFDTPDNTGQDFEYRIEARVTDASRREIVGNGIARVTRQRYTVYAEPGHNLYRPQDKVTVKFHAQDANDQPVPAAEGIVKVTRDYWYEIWLDPEGKEVKGEALKELQAPGRVFPPPPARPDQRDWRLKFRGYQHDDILTRTLKTDTNGVAELTFTAERDGYYRVAWSSEDTEKGRPATPITAETTVWVASNTSSELGYRHGGVEIIADQDTFRVGQTAPVMLSVPTSDRYVLFTVEGQDLQSYQLIHVTGTVKLIELPITEQHVPNIFLNAAMVSDRQIFTDTKEVVVPPTKNFLTVDVKSDREQYQPQESGTFTITTLDDRGEPVPAEVSFGLVDESVYYIQGDYAGDPRQFYFGQKRPHFVQTQSTFNQKSYAKLVEWEDHGLIDDRERDARLQAEMRKDESYFRDGENGALDVADGFSYAAKSPAPQMRALGGRGGGGGAFGGGAMTLGAVNSLAAPATAMPMAATRMQMEKAKEEPPGGGEEPAVQVRSDFRSTIVWQPDVMTGRDGKAVVTVKYPDSLTGWKATARAVTSVNQFGIATTNTHTKQPLIVRLQAPRFFLVGDSVVISAVINNNTDEPIDMTPQLEATGLEATGLDVNGQEVQGKRRPTRVEANGEARQDWVVHVTQAGQAKLKVTALGGKYTDAMEKTYTVYEHGIEKFVSKSGKVRGDDITVKLDLPKERAAGGTSLMVQVTPSMAVTMLDALPYLVDYPYGCTEQTMSRFLPAAITAKTLKELGLAPEDAMYRVFGGIEQSNAAATHPQGKHDLQKLADMERQGLDRLYDFQHGDGGWGWWKEGDSDHWMTAYVVWGLSLARDAGVAVKEDTLRRGVEYLDKRLVEEEENPDMQAWMLHAEGAFYAPHVDQLTSGFPAKAADNLWTRRDQLNAYTRALFALSQHYFHNDARAKTLIENLANGVKVDNAPDTSIVISGNSPSTLNSQPSTVLGTAHWGEDGVYWRWSDGGVEATAFALRAMLAIDPTNKLVEPVSNWLIKNRRGAQWNNTRDTAITVLAMNDYLRVSGELSPDLEYEVLVNGKSVAKKKFSGKDVFDAPSQYTVDPKLLKDGENDVRIVRRSGQGAIYFAANATFFSQEEPITPAGSEIFVRRQYYKLVGRPTLLKGYVYEREPLNDGDSVISGERIETLVTIEAKNNYEYLLFEDLKPAGFEAVALRSGESLYARELKSGAVEHKLGANAANAPALAYEVKAGDTLSGIARANGTTVAALRQANSLSTTTIRTGQKLVLRPNPVTPADGDYTGRTRWVYQELRDRKTALFIDKLPQGIWEIQYDYRAEVPGEFHALPVVGRAMYVPEIRCNGQEIRVKVEDAKP